MGLLVYVAVMMLCHVYIVQGW